ncbi:PadR family transcriptional regulator [Allocoprobacillus halotolerans]|uniref:PadR family transcriptional regulator n=1 Tax=Allocoprobacillus halotolerans TaxID=2944914 RepID=A0ABY5I112_9FIRM|nr:PadR family transcriptional regulator [Allocoprobacillus halotolerans]UTY38388.1 PadR family transcriptional regulator [Allocoprobacillus halotolerans]
MNERYERQLKKGILEILVLQLLSKEKMYGYQMILCMKEKSHGMFEMKEGTLYPILYRLEEDECVQSQWSPPQNKEVSRKYYCITEKGLTQLDVLKKLWKRYVDVVDEILEENEYE